MFNTNKIVTNFVAFKGVDNAGNVKNSATNKSVVQINNNPENDVFQKSNTNVSTNSCEQDQRRILNEQTNNLIEQTRQMVQQQINDNNLIEQTRQMVQQQINNTNLNEQTQQMMQQPQIM